MKNWFETSLFCLYCDSPSSNDPICDVCHIFIIYSQEYNDAFLDPVGNDGRETPNWPTPEQTIEALPADKKIVFTDALKRNGFHRKRNVSRNLSNFSFPSEIQFMILRELDEVSLLNASKVCKTWRTLIKLHYADQVWEALLVNRWPFQCVRPDQSWLFVYSKMMDSFCCKKCFLNATGNMPVPNICLDANTMRNCRIEGELKALNLHGSEDIQIVPMDPANYNWIARLKGPQNSPYRGGIFYINLKISKDYPFKPPTVRFLTKIYHPNVSRHGDISCNLFLPHLWTPATTLHSSMVAIKNLLANPKIKLSEVPIIAKDFIKDKLSFDDTARQWTKKYAINFG